MDEVDPFMHGNGKKKHLNKYLKISKCKKMKAQKNEGIHRCNHTLTNYNGGLVIVSQCNIP